MNSIDYSFGQKGVPPSLLDMRDLESIAKQLNAVGSWAYTALGGGVNSQPVLVLEPAAALRLSMGAGESFMVPLAPTELRGTLAVKIPEREFIRAALGPVPVVARMLPSDEDKFLAAFYSLLAVGAECAQANPGTEFTTTLRAFSGSPTPAATTGIAFDVTLPQALSDKAKLAIALIDSWYAEDQKEHAETLKILRTELETERGKTRRRIEAQ